MAREYEPLRMETVTQASQRLGWSRDKIQRFLIDKNIPQYGDKPLLHEIKVLDKALLKTNPYGRDVTR